MHTRAERTTAFLMLLPSIVLLGVFVYGFIGLTVRDSMTDWGENRQQAALSADLERNYIGTDNYENLLTKIIEFRFRNAMVNTFFFTLLFIGGCIAMGFFLALLLDQKIVGEAFFRTTFLFPMALSFLVTGTIWRWLLQPGGGINVLPERILGLSPLDYSWLSSKVTHLPFPWTDVPLYITYIGVAMLAFVAFNYLSQENDRIGLVFRLLVRLITVTGLAGFALALAGFDGNLWLAALLIAVIVVDLMVVNNPQSVQVNPIAPRDWRPLFYIIIGAAVFIGAYLLGFWENIFLETPRSEPIKGYNAALTGIIIAAIWQMSGYTMAMFLAGMRGVPEELREAARVDGCTEVQVYTSIVMPLLRPIVLSAMIILGHISLKIFDLVFAMSGRQNQYTVVPGMLVYENFLANRYASAAAVAVVMLVLVAMVIIPYLYSSLRSEEGR